VVQNVVGLGQEIGLEGHLLSLRTGVDEGRDVAALGGYKMNLARALGHEVGSSPMSDGKPIVFVVDDDVSVRESLELLIRCEGWQPEIFASAQEFLSRPRVLVPSCLILDVSLPGLNGLDLQKRIASDRIDLPIIFITGHGDIPMSVQA
jgi:PleD family two-component response regulator